MGVRDEENKPPEIPDEQPKSGENFPNPDLNPMTNPVLEKSLGRWAQVYYTSPPEKREQAVQELLRELEGIAGKNAEKPPEKPPATSATEKTPAATSQQEALICPACLHKNQGRHRFCGFCGFPLETETAVAKEAAQSVPLPTPVDRSEDGWQWLREKNLAELARSQKPISPWNALLIVLVLLALGGASLLLWQNRLEFGGRVLPVSSKPAASARKSETPPTAAEKPAEMDLPPAQPGSTAKSQAVTTTVPPESAGFGSAGGAAAVPGSGPGYSAEEGSQELVEGRRYLEGQGVPKNTAIAATWLWKSVARQNVNAVLLLSDLYVRGDGVPQSCDQARILLRAAAQKGSAQARDKLTSLERSGCR
ncbi:MAG TPA: hypothetical protein VEV41_19120 [Terriglobales bacterium]|nr:hypothetical protein [Terriglobales bacterium]